MLDNVSPDLLVGIESIEMIQSLGEASEMVVNFKLTSKFRQLLQFPQEWQILARVLDFVNAVLLPCGIFLPSEPAAQPSGLTPGHTHTARESRGGGHQSRNTYVQWHPQLAQGFVLLSD